MFFLKPNGICSLKNRQLIKKPCKLKIVFSICTVLKNNRFNILYINSLYAILILLFLLKNFVLG